MAHESRPNWRSRAKGIKCVLQAYPSTLLWPLLLFAILCGVGVWAVTRGAQLNSDSAKAKAAFLAQDAALEYQQLLSSSFSLTKVLAAIVEHDPLYDDVSRLFNATAPALFLSTSASAIQSIQLAPSGVIRLFYPAAGNEVLQNLDVFAFPDPKLVDSARAAVANPVLSLEGPYGPPPGNSHTHSNSSSNSSSSNAIGGDPCIVVVRQAVFARAAAGVGETFGRPSEPGPGCGPPCDYNATTGLKFWGMAAVTVALDRLQVALGDRHVSTPLRALATLGYRYALTAPVVGSVPGTGGDHARTVVEASPQPPGDDVVHAVLELAGVQWILTVGPCNDNWVPGWYGGVVAAVVVASLGAAALLFALLASRRRNYMLLMSLLPPELIRDLKAEQAASPHGLPEPPRPQTDCPADLLLDLLGSLLEGRPADLREVVLLRTVLRRHLDVYQPLNLGGRLREANLDSDVATALMRQLGNMGDLTIVVGGDGSPAADSATANGRGSAGGGGGGGGRDTWDAAVYGKAGRMRGGDTGSNHHSSLNAEILLNTVQQREAMLMMDCHSMQGALSYLLYDRDLDHMLGIQSATTPGSLRRRARDVEQELSLDDDKDFERVLGTGSVAGVGAGGAGSESQMTSATHGSLNSVSGGGKGQAGSGVGPGGGGGVAAGFNAAGPAACSSPHQFPVLLQHHASSNGGGKSRLGSGSGFFLRVGATGCQPAANGASSGRHHRVAVSPLSSFARGGVAGRDGGSAGAGAGAGGAAIGEAGCGGGGGGGGPNPAAALRAPALICSASAAAAAAEHHPPSLFLPLPLQLPGLRVRASRRRGSTGQAAAALCSPQSRSQTGLIAVIAAAEAAAAAAEAEASANGEDGGAATAAAAAAACKGNAPPLGCESPLCVSGPAAPGAGGGCDGAAAAAAAAGGLGGGRGGGPPSESDAIVFSVQAAAACAQLTMAAAVVPAGRQLPRPPLPPAAMAVMEAGEAAAAAFCGAPARPVLEEVERLLALSEGWQFDTWGLQEASGGHALSCLGFYLLHRSGLVERFKIEPLTVARLLRLIESGYQASNPYHNAAHAADVLRTLHVLLHGAQLTANYVDPLGLLACYFAAIIHDYGHPGLTNDFLVASGHLLALRYNDRAPLESHHAAAAFTLMADRQEVDLTSGMSRADRAAFRKQVIDMVLATDMKQHFAILKHFTTVHRLHNASTSFAAHPPQPPPAAGSAAGNTTANARASVERVSREARANGGGGGGGGRLSGGGGGNSFAPPTAVHSHSHGHPRTMDGPAGPDSTAAAAAAAGAVATVPVPVPVDEAERLLSLQVALKVADIGHLGADLERHKRWLRALEEEFFLQGDRERELGLPISPLFDRAKQGVSKSQVGFFDFVALPLVKALTGAFPGAAPLLQCFQANYQHWRDVEEGAAAAAASPATAATGPAAASAGTAGAAAAPASGAAAGPAERPPRHSQAEQQQQQAETSPHDAPAAGGFPAAAVRVRTSGSSSGGKV